MAFLRLLQYKPDGEFVFREPSSDNVPAYAILSHTWGNEEVEFPDMDADADMGKTMGKAGWKKIEFCAKQAAADGLQYFWIDTCCIDRKNAVELGAAVNSMFRWYQNAARCYVYLSDVPQPDTKEEDQELWKMAFRKSRWFTRGWTLQELIAPRSVEFFSSEGRRLGSKLSLETEIHEVTGIAKNALRGDTLSSFSIKERRSWAERRNTAIEEDGAYCLIGIFNVAMVLNYGEGRDGAFRRLDEEIHKLYKGADFEKFAIGLNLTSFPEAAQFVAREKELLQMHELLYGHSGRSCVVLHGLGGIGKTQLAISYAIRHEEKFTAIFWLNANDDDSLRLSFRAVAQQILKYQPSTSLLTSLDLKDLDQVVYAVKTWLDLQKNTHWLMIYDNYDNPRIPGSADSSTVDIRRFLPESNHGSIIITTRSSQVSEGHRIHVQKLLNVQEGLQILSNTSGRKDIGTDPHAIALVEELDGLPLALSTAGAYLEHLTTTFSDYLRLYRASWSKLQRTSPQLNSYENRSLYTTWQITFDRIEQQNAASANLLKLWAYFDRNDLWFELVQHARVAKEEWIEELVEDELNFNEAVTLLCSFGLVDRSLQQQFGNAGYSVHGCVHSWSISVLNKQLDNGLARLALTCTAMSVSLADERNSWALERRLLQHAARQKQLIQDGVVDAEGMEGALYNLGSLFAQQGKLAEAEAMYSRALQGYEQTLGPQHELTLRTVNNLGLLYIDQGKLAEAESMYSWALQGKEEVFGPKHISTLTTVNNLGVLYASQGKLVEAEAMYRRALQGEEEALGRKHTSTLNTVNNLGSIYAEQGKLAAAEAMYTRALHGYEEALGPKHTSTLDTVNNLGNLLKDQGKLTEAEAMYNRALQGYEEALGPNHTLTLTTVHNLGSLYAEQGNLAEAEAMYSRALQGKEEVLGPKHVSTLDTVNNLGNHFKDQGKLAEAQAMYNRALQGKEQALGPKHISTLRTAHNLGVLYAEQGNLVEAEAMYSRALHGYEEALGAQQVESYLPALRTMVVFGDLFSQTERKDSAKVMYSRALSGFSSVQGPSSKWCKELEDRLQALEVASAESGASKDKQPDLGAPKSSAFLSRNSES